MDFVSSLKQVEKEACSQDSLGAKAAPSTQASTHPRGERGDSSSLWDPTADRQAFVFGNLRAL